MSGSSRYGGGWDDNDEQQLPPLGSLLRLCEDPLSIASLYDGRLLSCESSSCSEIRQDDNGSDHDGAHDDDTVTTVDCYEEQDRLEQQHDEAPPSNETKNCYQLPEDFLPEHGISTIITSPPPASLPNSPSQEAHIRWLQARYYGVLSVRLALLEQWKYEGMQPIPLKHSDMYHHMFTLPAPATAGHGDDDQEISFPRTNLQQRLDQLVKDERLFGGQPYHPSSQQRLQRLAARLQEAILLSRQLVWRQQELVTNTESTPLDQQPFENEYLMVRPSNIPNAGNGLFSRRTIPKHAIICYYTGQVHSRRIADQTSGIASNTYLLEIGRLGALDQPWWYATLRQEPATMVRVENLAAGGKDSGKDSDNESCRIDETHLYDWLRQAWNRVTYNLDDALVVYPASPHILARYINDGLLDGAHNVDFVMDPIHERAVVVTLREIMPGEELYVSYGDAYWRFQAQAHGIVPQSLTREVKEGGGGFSSEHSRGSSLVS